MLKSTDKGSFVVRILDRQYHTWQGTVTWISNNEKKNFRSAIELIRIIDEALNENDNNETDGMADEAGKTE